jgi:hypothetical protein
VIKFSPWCDPDKPVHYEMTVPLPAESSIPAPTFFGYLTRDEAMRLMAELAEALE